MALSMGLLGASLAGAAGAYELIESNILTSSASSVTFSALDTVAADYKHLQIRMVALSDTGTPTYAKLNGSTSGYYVHYMTGNGSNVSSGAFSSTYAWVGTADTVANYHAPSIIDFLDFASTNKTTTIRSLFGRKGSGSNINLNSNLWNSTAAVTSIELYPNSGSFVSGSRFSLYGIRG